MSKPYKVQNREFGRGPVHTESFATLQEAQDYIKEHWQGADYMDGRYGFHTDYCQFSLVGFTLQDIGRYKPHYYTDPDTGKEMLDWMDFEWKDLAEAA
jgi:hypothetical protein